MNVEKLMKELKDNGFKVIDKNDNIRIIKNNKAITYNKNQWNNLEEVSKSNELYAIYKAFS